MTHSGGRTATLRRVLALSYRADRGSTILLFVLIVAKAASIPLSAIAVSLLVNASQGTAVFAVVVAATLTAAAYAIQFVVSRAVLNLQEDMSHKVELILQEELVRLVAAPRTLDAFWDPDYLDSLDALRRNMYPLANYLWRTVETLLALLGLALSVWLLVDVNPLLVLLAVFSVAPLVANSIGQRWIRTANLKTAPLLRLEKAIHQLATDPSTAKELLIYGGGEVLSQRAATLWRQVLAIKVRARTVAGLIGVTGWVLFALALVGSLILVSQQVAAGALQVGSIALILTLSTRLKNQISEALYGLTNVSQATELIEHFDRVRDFRTQQTEGVSNPPPFDGLRFEDVGFRYPNQERPALEHVTLDIPAGSCVSLVGLNGAGKSTFINLVLGLTTPTTGRILVNDGAKSAAFQDFVKPLFTVREAVGLGDPSAIDRPDRVASAVDRAQASAVLDRFDEGQETHLGLAFGGIDLSQGQWQRIALARGLMHPEPLIMAFDEPTSAMDPQAEHDLFRVLMQETRELGARLGTISFFVSHRFTSADLADLVVVVADGRIVEFGTHKELIQANGPYAGFFDLQRAGYE